MMDSLLSLLVFVPLAGMLLIIALPLRLQSAYKWIALSCTGIQLALGIICWCYFDDSRIIDGWEEHFQFVEKIAWIRFSMEGLGSLNVDYFLGVDGISLPLVALSALVLLIGVISSWNITHKTKGYFALYLLLGASVVGCFVALDFFLFYVFFEFMLLPMFFLIGIWGGARRQYASIKFFLYTLLGSLLILIVMIGLYLSVEENGGGTFSFIQLLNPSAYTPDGLFSCGDREIWGLSARTWGFWLLVAGFAIKLPTVPVHTWLPDAHVEAPTPVSVILAGLLLKIGGYGLIRIAFGFFPEQAVEYSMEIGLLGAISIIYGGMNAMAQDDFKRLVAYSSVSHMGFVLVGFSALSYQGFSGSVFHMVSHGLLSPALFLLVGVLYDRTKTRQIDSFSGLASQMPVYTFMTGLFFFASLGLPGFSGFVGELLVLMGAFGSDHVPIWIAVLATTGILISAAYFLWTIQRLFFGTYWVRNQEWSDQMTDLTRQEWIMLAPLAFLVLLLGIYPSSLLRPINDSIEFWLNHILSF